MQQKLSNMRVALASLLLLTAIGAAQAMKCIGQNGKPVDWWAIVKLPLSTQYLYADASSEQFQLSEVRINDDRSAMTQTIATGLHGWHAFYNDQPTKKVMCAGFDKDCGHTKGAVAVDDNLSGYWLIQTLPRFPIASDGDFQPTGSLFDSNVAANGQSALCVSIKGEDAYNVVANALKRNIPHFFGVNIPDSIRQALPALTSVVVDGNFELNASSGQETLTSAGGKEFVVFSKNSAWGQTSEPGLDLYNELVSKYYQADTEVETWKYVGGKNSAPNYMPSFCAGAGNPPYPFSTFDIKKYTIEGQTIDALYDHSKIAIVQNQKTLCFGDINRAYSQSKRAGGTVCFDSPSLWSEMSANIELWDPQCSGDVPTEYLRIAPHYPKDLNPTPPPRVNPNDDEDDGEEATPTPKPRKSKKPKKSKKPRREEAQPEVDPEL